MADVPLEFIAMKMAEAHAHGAATERARIVAFIRLWAETETGWQPELVALSDAIERGDHAKPEPARPDAPL